MVQFDTTAPITEADIQQLIDDKVEESDTLDYKAGLSSKPPGEWGASQEFAKDVAAFANARGGQLVFGVRETGKVPTGIHALADPYEQLERRLRKWALDSLSPERSFVDNPGRSPSSIRLGRSSFADTTRRSSDPGPAGRLGARVDPTRRPPRRPR